MHNCRFRDSSPALSSISVKPGNEVGHTLETKNCSTKLKSYLFCPNYPKEQFIKSRDKPRDFPNLEFIVVVMLQNTRKVDKSQS